MVKKPSTSDLWHVRITVSYTHLDVYKRQTVMCFVTSANKMLTDFLGSDYGEYGGAYSLMLAIPALLLGCLLYTSLGSKGNRI